MSDGDSDGDGDGDGNPRIERALAELGAEHEPPADWQARVVAAIASERIEAGLARIGEEHEPPPGWETRVLAATRERPGRRWWWLAIPAFATAAAIIILLLVWPRSGPQPLEVAISTEHTKPVVRTRGGGGSGTRLRSTAPLGDTLHARASGGREHRAVWIYRGERDLLAACPGTAGCREAGDALIAEAELRVPGIYNVVILTASAAIPVPQGSYDHDLAVASRAGAQYLEHEVEVR